MSKYKKNFKGVDIDVYDLLVLYEVSNPAIQHALKKLLMAGKRGHKDKIQDLKEAIESIERGIEMEQYPPVINVSNSVVDSKILDYYHSQDLVHYGSFYWFIVGVDSDYRAKVTSIVLRQRFTEKTSRVYSKEFEYIKFL